MGLSRRDFLKNSVAAATAPAALSVRTEMVMVALYDFAPEATGLRTPVTAGGRLSTGTVTPRER